MVHCNAKATTGSMGPVLLGPYLPVCTNRRKVLAVSGTCGAWPR